MTVIRAATLDDCQEFVRIHKSSEVFGLLGVLPNKVLEKYFYVPLLKNSTTTKLVRVNERGRICGTFVCKDYSIKDTSSNFTYSLGLFLHSILAIPTHPKLIIYLLNHLKSIIKDSITFKGKNSVELQILLVDKEFQGFGYGSELIKYWLSIPRQSSCTFYVKTQSKRAVKFYEREGFAFSNSTKTLNAEIFLLTREVQVG